MKKHLILYSTITQSIITIIATIIAYNISSISARNWAFFILALVSAIFWGIVCHYVDKKGFQGIVIGLSTVCIMITGITIYNSLDSTFLWSKNAAFDKVSSQIKNEDELLFKTDYTSLYIDKENKTLFSITDVGDTKYFYQTNITLGDKSEYQLLYSDGMFVESENNRVSSLAIHPSSISTLTSYEHLVEISIGENVYLAPTFIMGNIKFKDEDLKPIINIEYSKDSDQNYTISKINNNLVIQNIVSSFITPFTNVEYNKDALFQNRYTKYMQSFNSDYVLTNGMTFGLSKTLEVKDDNIERISFYYELMNGADQGGLLMEIVYKNGTADISYIKEMYAENFTSATVIKEGK